MEREIYNTRVIPFVRYEKRVKNGKEYEVAIDNLTSTEIKNMSCDPRMLWETKEHVYMAEMPLTFKGGTGIKWSLYYVFDELTEEEKAKYFDRSVIIRTTIEKVVEIYGDSSKSFFGKRKVKEKK